MTGRIVDFLVRGQCAGLELDQARGVLLNALTQDDQARLDAAILECTSLARAGDSQGRAVLEEAVRRLSRQQQCEFHRPEISYMRTREQAAAARDDLLEAARRGSLLAEPAVSQRAFARAQAFFEELVLMNEVRGAGGLEQQRAIQLLGTHLKLVSIEDHARRERDRERLTAHWSGAAEAQSGSPFNPRADEHGRSEREHSGVRRSCDALGREVLLCPQGQWLTCEWSIPDAPGKSLCGERCVRHGRVHVAVDRINVSGDAARTLALLVSAQVPDRARGLSAHAESPWASLMSGERMLHAGESPAIVVVANERVKTGKDLRAIVADLQVAIAAARGAQPRVRGVAGSLILIDRPELEACDMSEADTAVEACVARLAGTAIHHSIEFVFCGRGYLGNPEIHRQAPVRAWMEAVAKRHPEILCLLAPRTLSFFLRGLVLAQPDDTSGVLTLDQQRLLFALESAFAALLDQPGGASSPASWPPLLQHELAYSVAQNFTDAQRDDSAPYVILWPQDN